MGDRVLEEITAAYRTLQSAAPGHELLRYLDTVSESGITYTRDRADWKDFTSRFGGERVATSVLLSRYCTALRYAADPSLPEPRDWRQAESAQQASEENRLRPEQVFALAVIALYTTNRARVKPARKLPRHSHHGPRAWLADDAAD